MLIVKKFIIPFDSGIVVIKHWKIHNYIRGDRKKETVYPEEMALLMEKENGAYTLIAENPILVESPQETKRQKAYRESDLPYSFEYKIRQAFYGKVCPVCNFEMKGYVDECGIATDIHKPSIQHNIPISKGGKHELGNISVICHQCNVSLQDTETGRLNADEVIKVWDEICATDKCPSNDRQVTGKRQHRLGKDSIGKDSLGKYRLVEVSESVSEDNGNNEESQFELQNGTLGKGVVLLTPEQDEALLDKLGFDGYNHYVSKLADFIIKNDAKVGNHYATILKWAKEDSAL